MEADGEGRGAGRLGAFPAVLPSLSAELRGTKAWRARGIGSGSVDVDVDVTATSGRPPAAAASASSSSSSYSGTTCSVAALSLWCCPNPSFTCHVGCR